MICVLEVIEGPARGKRIWLKENQSLEVGRVSTAEFAIPADAHMSRRHLLFEAIANGFRVRDVGSANGTFVNNAKISVVELQTGDLVRAGMTVLSVSLREKGENPHDRDGLSFCQSVTIQSSGATVSGATISGAIGSEPEERSGTIRTVEGLKNCDLDSTVQMRVAEKPSQECLASSLPTEILTGKPAPTLTPPTALPAEDGLGRVWWKSYFTPTAVSGVFEQTSTLDGLDGNLVELVLKFAKMRKSIAVVNQTQLSPSGVRFLKSLYDVGKAETISWSLCFVKLNDNSLIVQLVKNCEGHDAMVVLGGQFRPGLVDLKPHANSLSYPSMFSQHILDQDGSFRKTLLKNDVFALYEPNKDGKTGLLING
ncbi:MAG: FHA domain-containing protein [Planctomycetota bacterium]|nr:FHA domain-containing protein [Planctomycetota bacterium]